MIALFAEGLQTAFFPCSLVLAVPSVAVALGARRYSAAAIGTFMVGLLASSWARFAGFSDVWPAVITGIALLAAALLLAKPVLRSESVSAGAAGLVAGGAAGSLWRPCVGFEFGEVLTAMSQAGPAGFGRLIVYVLGVMAPILALTAIANALPVEWVEKARQPLTIIGAGVLVMLGLAVFAGFDDHIISRLFELSSF